jgi:hypothetical protein
MTKGDAERRAEKLESHPEGSRRKRREEGLGASRVAARREHSGPETEQLLEAVVERENMWWALKQVERNKGAAGVDNMTVEQLRAYLREHWLRIKRKCWQASINRWWNAGASHMHAAFPKSYFDRCGLLSLLEQRLRFQWTS